MAAFLVIENVEKCVFVKDEELMIIDNTLNLTKNLKKIKCPSSIASADTTKNVNKSENKQVNILSADFSPCGNFLVVCDSNYRIILWKNEENSWDILSTRLSTRRCQKVIFSNLHSEIILADRGGDVFKFSSSELSKEGELILGHICFITDMCITSDDKYLATCDRDGKIRISNYPNCYNIHSYCLGHTMFISSAFFLDSVQHALISGSGDGTLKFWELNGVEKECESLCQNISFSDDAKECDIFSSIDDSLSVGLSKEAIQFSVQCCKIQKKQNILAIVFHFLKGIAVYKILDCKFQFQQFINLSCKVRDIIFLNNNNLLIILNETPMTFHEYVMNPVTKCYVLCTDTDISEFTKEVKKFYDGFENVSSFANYEHMLFKKSYDDDHEEHKSKKNKT